MSRTDSSESSSSAAVTKTEFNELMAAMKGIQSNMDTMKRVKREAADDRLVKKMRLAKGIKFK